MKTNSFIQIIKNSAWTGSMSLITAFCGFLISVVTARVLGPEGKGIYALAIMIMTTAAFLLNPSLYTAANYYFSGRIYTAPLLFTSLFIASIFSAFIAFMVAWNVAELFIHPISTQGAMLIGIGAGAVSLSSTMNGALYGLKKIRYVTLWTILSAILQALLVLLVGLYMSASLDEFIGIYIAFQVLDALSKTLAAGSGFWKSILQKPALVISILRFGFSIYLGRVLLMMSQRVDSYILFWLRGAESLGYYSISSTFAEQLWLLPVAFNLVMLTNITALPDLEKQEAAIRTSQLVIVITLTAAGMLGIFSFIMIPLIYGQAFRPATTPLLLSLPGVVAFSAYYILEPFFQARGKPNIPVKIAFWGAVANLLLSLGLVYGFGMIGAALAYSLSYIFQLLLTLKQFSRLNNTSFWQPVNPIELLQAGFQASRAYLVNRDVSHKTNL